jgi:hypothetical protein
MIESIYIVRWLRVSSSRSLRATEAACETLGRNTEASVFEIANGAFIFPGNTWDDVFEIANAAFIFPGNAGKAFFKTKVLQASSRPSAILLLQHDNSLPAATARSFVVSAPEPTLKAT